MDSQRSVLGHTSIVHHETKNTRIYLPEHYKLLPELLSESGYTTFNLGKTDYNFVFNEHKSYNYKLENRANLSELIDKQPFFGQIQLKGGKNNTKNINNRLKVDPNTVSVPADYPDNEVFREIVAQHYDAIRVDDRIIGEILQSLEQTGLDKNTIVVYFSDHGANNLLRHKQMVTEGGLHVPFVVMGPEEYVPSSSVRDDLVNMLDLSATTLAWAGISIPLRYEGQNLFDENHKKRSYVAAHKDRLDHTVDRVRSIRTKQYRYVRNYKLDRIFLQPQYRDRQPYTKHIHKLYKAGKLSKVHEQIYFGERPVEELYDILIDPEMTHNLARNTKFSNVLKTHQNLLDQWLSKGDMGAEEESIASLRANGDGKKWGEGVNPEYEQYRVDTDGDGLSDRWEVANGRDPNDGVLYFDFDCGSWQTEGWKSRDILSNLAGKLGYLDFNLNKNKGSIYRNGLQIIGANKNQAFAIRLKSKDKLSVTISNENGKLGTYRHNGDEAFITATIPIDTKLWSKKTTSLEISFKGKKNNLIEIDFIKQVN